VRQWRLQAGNSQAGNSQDGNSQDASQKPACRVRRGGREGSFHFGSSSGADCAGRTGADEDSVTFGVLWHWTEAATARVSVRSSSLQDLRERRPGSRHVDELLQSGGKVSFTLLSA
jgi:hypothetical protein